MVFSPLLKATELEKYYGAYHAVRGVDFFLSGNTYVTLLGPSGCGKTTILRMIAGFEQVSSGTLDLEGRSLVDLPACKRPINTVFQNYALFPHMSVAENVAFGLAYSNKSAGEQKKAVQAALEMVQLAQLMDRRPRQLSGGQQQRVALARAIINEPKILLLDEPLSALDRRMRKDMQIELKDLQRRLGMTFLHVTHDQEEAFALSDWIIVMNNGRIEQQGRPSDIYQRPANAYVADFIGGANCVAGRIGERSGEEARIDTSLGPVVAPCVSTLIKGEEAILCLRPEQIRIEPAGTIKLNVTHTVYRGSDWLVEARTQDGTSLNFHTPSSNVPKVGAVVPVAFTPSDIWIAANGARGQG